MRSRARLAAAVGVVSLTLAGCEGATDTEDRSAESPGVNESADGSAAAADMPARGTCWAVPAGSVMDPPDWFDDSSQVPCTEPHTTETALVIDLTEPTVAEAKKRVGECWNFVRVYVGINSANWVPWAFVGYLPSKEEVAAGASWLRCDAAFPETWAFEGARTTTVTASGLAHDHPQDFWACLDQPPTKSEQPFVSCDQPHAYEQTGTLALLNGITQYPSAAELAAQARTQCRLAVPPGYDNVSVTAVWDPRSTLKQSTSIAGPCFMFNADGQPLPAR